MRILTLGLVVGILVGLPAQPRSYQNTGAALGGSTETSESTVVRTMPTDDGSVTTVTTTDGRGNTTTTETERVRRVQNPDGSDTVTITSTSPAGGTDTTTTTRRRDGSTTVTETSTGASGGTYTKTTTTNRDGTTSGSEQYTDRDGNAVTTSTQTAANGTTTTTENVRSPSGTTTTTTTTVEHTYDRLGNDVTVETKTYPVTNPDGTRGTRTRVTETTTETERAGPLGGPRDGTVTTTVRDGTDPPVTTTTTTRTAGTIDGYTTTETTTDGQGRTSTTETTVTRTRNDDGSSTTTETVKSPSGESQSTAITRRDDGSETTTVTGTDASGRTRTSQSTTKRADGTSTATEEYTDPQGNAVRSTTETKADGSTDTTRTVRSPSGETTTTRTQVGSGFDRYDGDLKIETVTYPVTRPDGTIEWRTRVRRTSSRRDERGGFGEHETKTTTTDRPATPSEIPSGPGVISMLPSPGSACGEGDEGCTSLAACLDSSCLDVAAFCARAGAFCSEPGAVDDDVQFTFTGTFANGAPANAGAGRAQAALDPPPVQTVARLGRSLVAWLLPARIQAAEPPTVRIVANGASLGQSFEIQVVDPDGLVRSVAMPAGVVLQPIAGSSRPFGREARVPRETITREIGAYCLDFAKEPPAPGQVFRVAPPDVQQRFAPLRRVLQAADRVSAELHPDSDPSAYLDAIRQYALWSRIEGWDEAAFGSEFVERTKKNAANAGVAWTAAMERTVRGVVPGRWRDIATVLEAAGQPLSPR